jgi:hypothetical protein
MMATDRRASVRVDYPFVPGDPATDSGWLVEAVKDVRLAVDGPEEVGSLSYGITKTHFGALVGYAFDGTNHMLVFHAVVYGLPPRVFASTFVFPANAGLLSVGCLEGWDSFLVVDSSGIVAPSVSSSEDYIPAPIEVEPACCCWAGLNSVTRLRLFQEYRQSDPKQRPTGEPDSLVLDLPEVGGPGSSSSSSEDESQDLRLADGYNCRLSYDEGTGTLYIEGGAGLGLGLPDGIPWDSAGSSGAAVWSMERYGDSVNYNSTDEFSNGSEIYLTMDVMAEGSSISVAITVDGVVVSTPPTIGPAGWERYQLSPAIGAGTHTVAVTVTGGTAYWGLRLHAGLPPIKRLNGLNNGGNVEVRGVGAVGVLLAENGIDIRLLRD